MESEILAGLMSFLTATAGLFGTPVEDGSDSHNHSSHSHKAPGEEDFEFGTSHEHALFYLNIDGEEVNFTQRRYQLRSKYVHLENFKPHIVHKHTENVTWGYFLDTIDVKINESCVNFKDRNKCGNLSVILNGEESNLDNEVQRGDNLAILLDAGNLTERYMGEELPEAYTKKAPRRGL